MRPRSFDRGDDRGDDGSGTKHRHATVASMRPRSFDRGDLPVIALTRPTDVASMRPRSFDRGDEKFLRSKDVK